MWSFIELINEIWWAVIKLFALLAFIGFICSGVVVGYKTGIYLFESLGKILESSF